MEQEEISKYIEEARQILSRIDKTSSDKNIGENIRDVISSNSGSIQDLLNKILGSQIIDEDDVSRLNEEVRRAKMNLLRAETQKSTKKLIIIGATSFVIIGFLWYLTSNKFVK